MKRIAVIFTSVILIALVSCASNAPTRITGFAMDTEVSITVYGDTKVASDILHAVTNLENEISWNVLGSDTDKLNKNGEVTSATLAQIITTVSNLTADTDGKYSLAVRELCALWDINSGSKVIPSKAEITDILARTGGMPTVNGDMVILSGNRAIDLGSVGKGAACDLAAEIFSNAGQSGIASIGSSLALCGDKPSAEYWSVTVADPDNRNMAVGTLYLDGGVFVSTSNASERGFDLDGIRYHHIMNAVTGYPSISDLKSITVIANSGVISDALSTACYIVGYDKSLTLLKKHNANAVFITANGEIRHTDGIRFEVVK